MVVPSQDHPCGHRFIPGFNATSLFFAVTCPTSEVCALQLYYAYLQATYESAFPGMQGPLHDSVSTIKVLAFGGSAAVLLKC
jgi:hypothetical protein